MSHGIHVTRGLVFGLTLVSLSLGACSKKSAEQAAAEAASASTTPAGPSSSAFATPHVWKMLPRSPDAGTTPGTNVPARRKNMEEMKARLLQKQDAGPLDEREQAMLGILCKNLGDPSCTPPEKKKGGAHAH